ncbi:hypothetical protein SAMN02910400_01867 [Lachnospiraceae bacterium C10]|nr:hypothetical protein SAMN02910400_01867 [Lachnospiraceae bacterium C10]
MVKITPRETGLAHDLYFECEASERLADCTPYFYACKEDWLIPILISDNPCVIDKGNEESDFADTIEWAKRNQGVLIKHWYGEVDDPQLIFAIENQHRREAGVPLATWGL